MNTFDLRGAFLVSRDKKSPKFGVCQFDMRLPDDAPGVTTEIVFIGADMIAVMSDLEIGAAYNVTGEMTRRRFEGVRKSDGKPFKVEDGRVLKARACHEVGGYGAKTVINNLGEEK